MTLKYDSPVFLRPALMGRALSAALVAGFCFTTTAFADGGSDAFRVRMEKWVEARTVLSKERSDWIVERQYLESTRDLLKDERDSLRDEIKRLEESQTGADQERQNLVLEKDDFQQSSDVLSLKIRALEDQVKTLVPKLPVPLVDRLEPLLVQIPENPDESTIALGQRLMNVLGVLSQTEKWNSTATFVGETRSVGGADRVQVRTLYWGLSQAVYVDAQGKTAGVGRPAGSSWEFVDDSSLVVDAKLLLDIYEGNVDTIAFVPMPVNIK